MRYALLLLPQALLSTVPQAQKARTRVGFVNVQQAVAAMPNSAAYLSLNKRVEADLKAKQANIQKLTAQAQKTRKAADIQALQKAQQGYASAQKAHQNRLAKEFKPLQTRLNSVVAAVARSSGFSVVLDRQVAASSGVVVYANTQTTDLTPTVVKALKK